MKKSPENDPIRLRHMLDFANKIREYSTGKLHEDVENNELLALALARLIELFGEAASQVSDETRAKHPQIPWRLIIDTRNRLIHGYTNLDLDRIWTTIEDDIPPLIAELEAILPPLDDDTGKSE